MKVAQGRSKVEREGAFELGLARYLRSRHDRKRLIELYGRFAVGDGGLEAVMRRAIWRAIARRFGKGVHVGSGAGFRELETFAIGNGVHFGPKSYVQGRFDGRCVIGDHTRIEAEVFLDARDLVIGNRVSFGQGAKVVGSRHTGLPANVPIIQTDLQIRRVRIGDGCRIGANAVILPGVTLGRQSSVRPGAVVTQDVPEGATVAGVPATVVSAKHRDHGRRRAAGRRR